MVQDGRICKIQESGLHPMELSKDYIRTLPKAELHVHIEGCMTPQRLHELSQTYDSRYRSLAAEILAQQSFQYEDFNDFLNTYKIACYHLRQPEDYLGLLDDLAEDYRLQHVRYAEIIYTPSIPWKWGRSGEGILAALTDSSRRIEEQQGTIIRWILDCVRQFGPEEAWRTARLAQKFQSRGVVGIGLGGDERSLPMSDYREVFLWAQANQLFVHVHAGEVGDPDQVWDALKILGANRIGHGIQSARDPRLMEYLREHAIGLDICLTSNLKTRAWAPLSEHPFHLLYRRGVPTTLNTDDPGLFQTGLTEELVKAVEHFELSVEDLHRIILQGVRSSFLPHDEKMLLMQKFQGELSA